MDDFVAFVQAELHIIHEAKDPGSESSPQVEIAFFLYLAAHVQDNLFQMYHGFNWLSLAFEWFDEGRLSLLFTGYAVWTLRTRRESPFIQASWYPAM